MGLGDNIRYLRNKYGYSQDFIANKLGYKSFTTIQKWESGVSEPPIKKLQELSELFNVDMDDMINKDILFFDNKNSSSSANNEQERLCKIFSKNLNYYMDKYGKTRQDMCETLGVKYTTFTDWVEGNSYPRIDKIELMANYFGISKSDLVENKNDTFRSDEYNRVVDYYTKSPKHRELFENIPDIAEDDLDLIIEMVRKLKK